MSKQLNIRSDEAYAAATRLAQRLGTTTTDAVLRALRRLEQDTFKPVPREAFSAEEAETYAHFRQLALKARGETVPAAAGKSSPLTIKPAVPPLTLPEPKSSEERITLALAGRAPAGRK